MADQMRNRFVYTVLNPRDPDALDVIIAAWSAAFPDAEEHLASARVDAASMISQMSDAEMLIAIAPSGQMMMVSPIDLSLGWEDIEHDLFAEIQSERLRQIAKGYTVQSDDEAGGDALITIAQRYLKIRNDSDLSDVRRNLVKSISVLVAAVEYIERAEDLARKLVEHEGARDRSEDEHGG